jgi:hypothetical protein
MTPRWYCVSKDGLATLCTGEDDAIETAEQSDIRFPQQSPHTAARLIDSEQIDILAAYSRTDGRREWVTAGTWLRPGEVLAHMNDPRKDAPHDEEEA